MDALPWDSQVIVIGTTFGSILIDESLRRPGRFDLEIEIPIPDEGERQSMLTALCRTNSASISNSEILSLASKLHGFSISDISLLFKEASLFRLMRNEEEMKCEDLLCAFKAIKPRSHQKALCCLHVSSCSISVRFARKSQMSTGQILLASKTQKPSCRMPSNYR